MGKIVGIDLGTTNSVVAIMEGKEVKVIPNAHGSTLTPSVVGFTEQGDRVIGQLARRQAIMNPRNTIFSIKRFMGRRRDEVRGEEKMVPYTVEGTGEEPVSVRVRDKKHTPQEISAMVLQSLKETAEAYLGEKVDAAVITCPAYFNDSQRQATKEAGRIAGFDVKRVINEPTAAALAYGMEKKKNQKIAIYDLGGGTFDISVLEIDNEVIQVLSTNGNTHLGGDDFDHRLIDYVAGEFQKQNGADLRKDPTALQRLKEACEKAKCELSSMVETEINLPFISMDSSRNPLHLTLKITRAKLEQLIGDLLQSSMRPVEQALADAKLKPGDINEVILVGGSTRIPLVQKLVRDYFGKEPNRSVNPDEVVAVGAAIQAAVLAGEMKDILLLDVTPLTLGIETLGGVRTPLINRNTTIPTKRSQVFSTASDSQPSVEIHIVQGEREMVSGCRTLGRFHLDGIPPAPRGVPQVEVTFDIDASGILSVAAKDLATNKEQSIRITASTGLSEEEVKRMVKDAEEHASEDKQKHELADVRNQADSLIYATERALKDFGDKVSESEKKKIEEASAKLRKTLEGENVTEIKQATEELGKASHEISKIMYEQAAAKKGNGAPAEGPSEPAPAPSQGKGKDDGDVIDAEFKAK